MDSTVTILIVVLVLALIGVAAWFLLRSQRSRRLREQFGPEYERSVAVSDDRRAAESELLEREKRHRDLNIRPLDTEERERFSARWTAVQQGFVDDPEQAVRDADHLVDQVMRTRGYPLDDFEQRAADISVEHPVVVQRYREARVIADANEAGRAGTEDLRQAVTSYRALVVALLEHGPTDRSIDAGARDDRVEPDRRVEPDDRVEPDRRVEPDPRVERDDRVDPDRRVERDDRVDPPLDAPDTHKETRA